MDKNYLDGLVSIIIPVYNAEKFLERTLNSVLAQTYKGFEVILVDDRSTDESAQVIAKYTAKHPEIKYHLQEKNMGAAVARNTALEIAQGRYVAFLDSDDEWYPEKLEAQLNLLKEKNMFFGYTAIEMVDENDNIVKGKREVKEEVDYKFLLRNTMIATSSVLVDRSKFGDFRMPLRRGGQDYATWLLLLRTGEKACGINEALVKYRQTSNSLSSNKFKSIRQVWEIQTQNEHINKFAVGINVFCFAFNAFKKYFF